MPPPPLLHGFNPTLLRGFYAIPALVGAGIVIVASRAGDHTLTFPIVGAAACFLLRMAGHRYGLGLPWRVDQCGLPAAAAR
jgi:uncharacterized membrane protein YeiH